MINLTQHIGTPEQKVINLQDNDLTSLKNLLTFDSLPTQIEIKERAKAITALAAKYNATSAMIGGAPYLMASLEETLKSRGITPFYAFSVRESVETIVDGTVKKVAIFRHKGFIEA